MKLYTNFLDKDLKKLNSKPLDIALSITLLLIFASLFGLFSKFLITNFEINKKTFFLIFFPIIIYISIQLTLNFKNYLLEKFSIV